MFLTAAIACYTLFAQQTNISAPGAPPLIGQVSVLYSLRLPNRLGDAARLVHDAIRSSGNEY
jgi:hypothetical protein